MKFVADPRYQLVMKYLMAIMSLAYVAMGTALLLSVGNLAHVPTVQKLSLGLMLICYGLFRAYRFVGKYLLKKKEENDEQ